MKPSPILGCVPSFLPVCSSRQTLKQTTVLLGKRVIRKVINAIEQISGWGFNEFRPARQSRALLCLGVDKKPLGSDFLVVKEGGRALIFILKVALQGGPCHQ